MKKAKLNVYTPKKRAPGRAKPRGVRKPHGNDGIALRVPYPYPMPKLLTSTLSYSEVVSVPSAAGSGLGSYTMRCNGMYDPNVTSVGHQPMYFDQLMAIYDHFHVVSSKCTWTITGSVNAYFAAFIDDDSSITTTTWPSAAERPGCQVKAFMPGGQAPLTFTQYWSADKAFGKGSLTDPELQGTSSADPIEQQTFNLFVYEPTGNGQSWSVNVKIEYLAQFSELASMGLS